MTAPPDVRHTLLLGLPTGIWQRMVPGAPPAPGDHVVVHPGLRAVVIGTTTRPAPLPAAAFCRVTDPDRPPEDIGRWEALLVRLGWRPLIPDPPQLRRPPAHDRKESPCRTSAASPRR